MKTTTWLAIVALGLTAGCKQDEHGLQPDSAAHSSDLVAEQGETSVSKTIDLNPALLDGPATIVVDIDGISHVRAHTDADAFLLQGWATARDRLFQMEMTRRRAYGTRAEVLGETYRASDIQSRALRFADWGKKTHAQLQKDDPELLGFFEAYAAGVNRYIQEAKSGKNGATFSPQFTALGFEPDPWTAVDSLVIEKMIAAGLSMRVDQDIVLGLVHTLFGEGAFGDLVRFQAFDREYVTPDFVPEWSQIEGGLQGSGTDEKAQLRAQSYNAMVEHLSSLSSEDLMTAFRRARSFNMSQGGSNNFAISGAHTASGAPMIAGDSHQGVSHPAVYYFIHLNSKLAGGTLDVIGASFPGVPFVVFGHNGVAAMMPTTNIYDVSDVYLEEWNAQAETVRFEGKDVPVEVRTEVLRIRQPGGDIADAKEETLTLRDVPHHGPMLPAEALGLPLPLSMSVRWTGYRPRSLGRAFFELGRATNFESFRAALALMGCGGQHWVYADVSGNVGYSSRVDVPIRETISAQVPPIRLLPGAGGYEWLLDNDDIESFKILPDGVLPWVFNPDTGYVGTANNDPVGQTDDNTPFDVAVYLSGLFDIGTRAYQPRVRFEQIRQGGKLDLESFAQIQLDTTSRLGSRLVPFVLDAAARRPELVTPKMRVVLSVLAEWDRTCGVESVAATVFHAWLAAFVSVLLQDEMGGALKSVLLDDLDAKIGLVLTKAVTHWLESTASYIDDLDRGFVPFPSAAGINYFDDKTTRDVVETRDEAILAALTGVLEQLPTIFAPLVAPGVDATDPYQWKWGLWHRMQLVDFAHEVLPAANSPSLPKNGGLYTVDVADYAWLEGGRFPGVLTVTNAPSNRFVVHLLADGVKGLAILPGGQDERPGSDHHNDQFEDFLSGVFRPLRFTLEEVADGSKQTIDFVGPEFSSRTE